MKNFQDWLNESQGLTKAQREFLDRNVIDELEWSFSKFDDKRQYPRNSSWVQRADGKVDIHGSFYCHRKGLKTLKGIVFGKVDGFFDVSKNTLTEMSGFPEEIGDKLVISSNPIASLVSPVKRVGSISAQYCNLRSLEGLPEVGDKNWRHSSRFYTNPHKGGEKISEETWDLLVKEMVVNGSNWENALLKNQKAIPEKDLLKLDLPPSVAEKWKGWIMGKKFGLS
jgi:hypothetical protein